jgi:hypothetical protein
MRKSPPELCHIELLRAGILATDCDAEEAVPGVWMTQSLVAFGNTVPVRNPADRSAQPVLRTVELAGDIVACRTIRPPQLSDGKSLAHIARCRMIALPGGD